MTCIKYLPLILLAACQPEPPSTNDATTAQQQADAPVRNIEDVPVDETAAAAAGENDGAPPVGSAKSEPAQPATIPVAFQGRWGMVPADCTSTRGDAKGLLVIDAAKLSFYESRATPRRITASTSDRVEGVFAFTGEGQEWTANVALARQGGTLIREEEGRRFTYKRCA